ncbi:MAG TPA: SPFH domain-containing protein [Lacipirellulaceae bacterium]|nr:SPFH domain-containing protein [Lacipirellulaceae bacterium]
MGTEQDFNSAARQAGREYRRLHSSMPSFVELAAFLVLLAITIGLAILIGRASPALGIFVGVVGTIASALLAASIKVANQWERGLVLRLGEFQSIRGPGLFFVVPIVDRVRMVDTRVLAADIARQEVITKDNVPVSINGALFFRVTSVEDAVMKIQDYIYGISLLAQTALRDVVGGMVLDELLSERERIGKMVEHAVETDSKEWGLHVTGIRLMDIDMPEDLKRIMSRQAGAEREKRATITKAEGDRLAAENLAAAAATMLASPGAMQLRTLQTLDGLGPTASNTVVLAIPVEVLQLAQRFSQPARS